MIPGQCAFFTRESHREPTLYLSSGSRPPLLLWSLFIQMNCVQPGTLFWSSDFGSRFNAPRKWTARAPGSVRVMTLGRAQGRVSRTKHGNQNFAFAVVFLAWRQEWSGFSRPRETGAEDRRGEGSARQFWGASP